MKTARLTGIRKFELFDDEKPSPEPGWVVVKLHRVGVCGSDIHYYTEGNIGVQVVKYPFAVGHECSGVVEEIGSGVEGLKPGQRVAIEPAIHCGKCYVCKMGRENICPDTKFLGCPGQLEGSLKEYLAMPASNCIPIPDSLDFDEAVVLEPFAITIHAVRLSNLQPGETVAVLGSGPIGLLTMMYAIHCGAEKAFATDKIPGRVAFAEKMGATKAFSVDRTDPVEEILEATGGRGVDAVYECAGEQDAIDQAIAMLRPGGRLMLTGIPEVERVSLIADKMRRKELLIQNVRRQNHRVEEAVQLASEKKVAIGRLVTHRFPLEDVSKAFDIVASYSDGVIKAMIDLVP